MDTIYMKERAYRLVENIRRENQREQRRLNEKLHSKQGIAKTHQLELSALTEEQRKVRQELSRIRKSSSTTWGLLPPRNGEPDYDENVLWELSNKRIKTEKTDQQQSRQNRRRHSQRARPPEPSMSFSDSDFSFQHHSDPGPSPRPMDVALVMPVAMAMTSASTHAQVMAAQPQSLRQHSDPKIVTSSSTAAGGPPRKHLKKKSQQQLDQENRRTEETLKKFNEAFPPDGFFAPLPKAQGGEGVGEREEVDDVDSSAMGPGSGSAAVLPFRRASQKGGIQNSFGNRRSNTTVSIVHGGENGGALPNAPAVRRESTAKSSIVAGRRSSSSGGSGGTISLPKPQINILRVDSGSESESSSTATATHDGRSRKNATVQIYPITVVDVQEARDNIVRRLVGNNGLQSLPKRTSGGGADSPKLGMRPTLSPIREQRTEMSLVSASMPEFVSQKGKTVVDSSLTTTYSNPTSINNTETQSPLKQSKQKLKRRDSEGANNKEPEAPKFDSHRYNPDGTVRTMHLLPDFNDSLSEAMKARYLRHKEKQWFERELNVSEIFAD